MKNGKRATVLVIDDEAANLGVLFEHLRQADFRVLIAEDGASALERARLSPPDIILLDINLPDTDGFELYHRLKSETADTPVIFLSALDDTAHKLKGLDLGAVDYITKPFQAQEVIARVEKHLTVHNLRRQLEEQNAQLRQEITARRRAEQELASRNQFIESVLKTLPNHLFIYDLEHHKNVYSSPYPRAMLGYSWEEFQNLGDFALARLVHPDDEKLLNELFQRLRSAQDDEIIEGEYRFQHNDGRWVWIFTRATAFKRAADGQVTQILGSAIDTTQRKRAEEALERTTRQLQSLLEHSPAFISIFDQDGRYLLVNPPIARSLGLPAQDIVGKTFAQLLPPDTVATFEERVRQLCATAAPLEVEDELDIDNTQHFYHSTLFPIFNTDGNAFAFGSIGTDITERVQAEEALQAYSERLEDMVQERTQELREAQEQLLRREKLAVMGQLAGGVAHELRNPLGSIRNAAYYLNMILESPDPKIKDSLQILDRGVDTAERIIHSLLDFARTNVPARQKMDLNHILQETLYRINVPENVQTTLQLDEALPPILADPDQLERVFDNIIRNALQAMPDGGRLVLQTSVRPRLFVPSLSRGSSASTSASTWVSISCSDTGMGIPPENLDKLFEPLFTTKTKGIGLGLAITQTLVQAHGGDIQVESQVGKGSAFTVRLPVNGEK